MTATPEGSSIGELLGKLAKSTGDLVHDEVELAKIEIGQKVSHTASNVGFVFLGGAVMHLGVMGLGLAVIVALTMVIPLWAAAALVGAVVLGIGWMLLQKGLGALAHLDPVPRQTLKTLEEDKQWVKEQVQ